MDWWMPHTTHNLTERNCTNNWIEIFPPHKGRRESVRERKSSGMLPRLFSFKNFLQILAKIPKKNEWRCAVECILIDFSFPYFVSPPLLSFHSQRERAREGERRCRTGRDLASRSVARCVCVTFQLHFCILHSLWVSFLSEFPYFVSESSLSGGRSLRCEIVSFN